jgi:toxin HigB-1
VIRNFRGKVAEAVFNGRQPRGFPHQVFERARNKLLMLDAAASLNDLQLPPSNKLHALGGDRKGQHAIRINDQWRICFAWKDGSANDVEIADYH